MYGARDYLCPVRDTEVSICASETTPKKTCGDKTVRELCELLMNENHISMPATPIEAKRLFVRLRMLIRSSLEAL